jgi:sugar phosphate isomerase/epimerase
MKYSFMSFSTPTLTLREMLDTARRYGYDGIEPRLDAKHAHGLEVATPVAERKVLRQTVADSGLEICCLATSLRYADPAQTADMLEQTEARLDLAADLGVTRLRVFGGPIPKELSREQAIATVAASLEFVASYAAERNVTLCMETHDDWCDPQHVAAVMTEVDHPFVQVNWDAMHPVRTGHATIEESFAILRPWIRHLHVHDGTYDPLKMVPMGEGQIDHRAVIRVLKTINYPGFLSGEWINWEPADVHLPRELAVLKEYEGNRT